MIQKHYSNISSKIYKLLEVDEVKNKDITNNENEFDNDYDDEESTCVIEDRVF